MKANRHNHFAPLLGCLLLPFCGLAAATAAGNQPVPAAETPQIPGLENLKLYQNRHGHILCADEETATRMLAALDRTITAFCTSFPREPGKGLYHQDRKDIAAVAAKLGPALKAAWTAPATEIVDPRADTGAQPQVDISDIKRQIIAQTKAQNPSITDQQAEEIFQKNLPQILKQIEQQTGSKAKMTHPIDTGTLGQRLLTAAYWPAAPAATHGAPCADWLDEAAVALTSGPDGRETRRARIAKMAAAGFKTLLPLDKLTTIDFPERGPNDVCPMIQSTDGSPIPDGTITIIQQPFEGSEEFKAQSLMLADFLTEKSDRPTVMGDLATAAAAGQSFAAWLSANGAAAKLGTDLAALDTAWQGWLKTTHGQVKAPVAAAAPGSLKPGTKVTPEAIAAADFIQGEGPKQWEPDKIYFIECWATWCAPCVQAIPHVNEMHEKFKDRGLRVIGMNVMETGREKVADFVKAKGAGMSYPVAYDATSGAFAAQWLRPAGVNGIPHVFAVRNGELLFHCHPMMITNDKVEKLLAGGEQADAVIATLRSGTTMK